ncbi:MAG: transposase [Bacillota bacterium]|nr:transposase [Bacillota bacterium]
MVRKEYVASMRNKYLACKHGFGRSRLLDEIIRASGYNRKYAIRLMQPGNEIAKQPKRRAPKPDRYHECLPAIMLAWEALDFCCAERLHPRLCAVAQDLARFGEIYLDDNILAKLAQISRATLARRLARLPKPYARPKLVNHFDNAMLAARLEVPIDHYDSEESRPGALEVDLLEHNGGDSSGFFGYTLCVTDVVSGWTLHRALLGKSQRAVFDALTYLLRQWPHKPWAIHSDNGYEFINALLCQYAKQNGLAFSRSRPYRKNDNAHVEQRNGSLRKLIGYDRFDTQQQVDWLNRIYDLLDPYANLVLPSMKLVSKQRRGAILQRKYDTARTPLARLLQYPVLTPQAVATLQCHVAQINPLARCRQIHQLIQRSPGANPRTRAADNDT